MASPRSTAGESAQGQGRFRVPEHVVFRSFPAETVVLNLRSGKYHGLNPSAGQILEALVAGSTLPEAAAAVAARYDRDLGATEAEARHLCEALLERGLVESDDDPEG